MRCSAPNNPLALETLQSKYETAAEIQKEFQNNKFGDYHFTVPNWPKDLLLSIVEENFSEQRKPEKNLGEFLRKNFTLEDILRVETIK